jgi:hypothetical protein
MEFLMNAHTPESEQREYLSRAHKMLEEMKREQAIVIPQYERQ